MNRRYSLTSRDGWGYVREVRRLVAEALAAHPHPVRDAAIMVASELVENAIKYGESVPEAPGVRFALTVADDGVAIEVTNGVAGPEVVRELEEHLARIMAAGDREALYLGRLRTLLADSAACGKLGLYRAGFEGGFDLACVRQGRAVTVIAKRGVR